jgi:hypothetical protein
MDERQPSSRRSGDDVSAAGFDLKRFEIPDRTKRLRPYA